MFGVMAGAIAVAARNVALVFVRQDEDQISWLH